MKGVLMKIFNQFGINLSHFSTKEFKCQYSETAIILSYQDTCIAEVGKFSHETLSRMAIKKEVFYVDVNIDLLFNIQKKIKLEYTQIPRFPSIKRDLSLLVSKDVSYSNIQQVIKKRKSDIKKYRNEQHMKEINKEEMKKEQTEGRQKERTRGRKKEIKKERKKGRKE